MEKKIKYLAEISSLMSPASKPSITQLPLSLCPNPSHSLCHFAAVTNEGVLAFFDTHNTKAGVENSHKAIKSEHIYVEQVREMQFNHQIFQAFPIQMKLTVLEGPESEGSMVDTLVFVTTDGLIYFYMGLKEPLYFTNLRCRVHSVRVAEIRLYGE